MATLLKNKNIWDYVGNVPAIFIMVDNLTKSTTDKSILTALRPLNSFCELMKNANSKTFIHYTEKNRVMSIKPMNVPSGDHLDIASEYKHLHNCTNTTEMCFSIVEKTKKKDSELKGLWLFIDYCREKGINEAILALQTPELYNLSYYRNLSVEGINIMFFEPEVTTLQKIIENGNVTK